MTAQGGDILIYKGETYYIATELLEKYLVKRKIGFYAPTTAC